MKEFTKSFTQNTVATPQEPELQGFIMGFNSNLTFLEDELNRLHALLERIEVSPPATTTNMEQQPTTPLGHIEKLHRIQNRLSEYVRTLAKLNSRLEKFV